MQTIIIVDDHETTTPLGTAHGEKVHRLVIHTKQEADAGCLIGLQERTSLGQQRGEVSIQHIEIAAFRVVLHIGIKPQEAGKAHEEHQVEIGERTAFALVEPTDGVDEVGKQGFVGSLFLQGTVEELRQE